MSKLGSRAWWEEALEKAEKGKREEGAAYGYGYLKATIDTALRIDLIEDDEGEAQEGGAE